MGCGSSLAGFLKRSRATNGTRATGRMHRRLYLRQESPKQPFSSFFSFDVSSLLYRNNNPDICGIAGCGLPRSLQLTKLEYFFFFITTKKQRKTGKRPSDFAVFPIYKGKLRRTNVQEPQQIWYRWNQYLFLNQYP